MIDYSTLVIPALTSAATLIGRDLASEVVRDSYQMLKKLLQDRFADKEGIKQELSNNGIAPEDWETLKTELTKDIVEGVAEIMSSAQRLQMLVTLNQHGAPFLAPPKPYHDLVGRSNLVEDSKQQLLNGGYLALQGLPGVGKTALAVELSNDLDILDHFSDGVLWAGLGCNPDVFLTLSEWCFAVNISSEEITRLKSIDARTKAIQARIGMKKMLLVIDDAWSSTDALNFKIGGPNCAYVVTTRLPEVALCFAGIKGMQKIASLDRDDGLMLLDQFVPNVINAERDRAQELIEKVDGLPLAIILIGSYLQVKAFSGQPRRIQETLKNLLDARKILEIEQKSGAPDHHPSLAKDVPLSLMAAISVSYEALDANSRRMLDALSVFPPKPNSFSEKAALKISAGHEENLDTLTDYGLLESIGRERYTLHQTISDYARIKLAENSKYEKKIYDRMTKYFMCYVEAHTTDFKALNTESTNILAALQVAKDQKMNKILVRGINAFYHFMEGRGLYKTAESYLNQTAAAAKSLGDNAGLATTLLSLGRLTEKRGNYSEAEKCYRKGLTLARSFENSALISDLLRNLGVLLSKRGDDKEARKCFEEGLEKARNLDDPRLISDHLHSLGILYDKKNDFESAEKCFEEGLEQANKVGYQSRISGLLNSMGILESNRGDLEKAEEYFNQSLDSAHKIGNQTKVSSCLVTLGFLELNRKRYRKAIQYSCEGLKLVCEIGYYDRIKTYLKILSSSSCLEENLLRKLKMAYENQNYDEVKSLVDEMEKMFEDEGSDSIKK